MKNVLSKLHDKFREFIGWLVFDKNCIWLEFLISCLCELEMQIPLLFNKEYKYVIDKSDIRHISPPPEEKESYAQRVIPKNTLYCDDCEFRNISRVAIFFYGYQSCGYCYYLAKGDFSFIKPTDLLWDGCKCCGMFDDIEDEIELPIPNLGQEVEPVNPDLPEPDYGKEVEPVEPENL